MPSLSMLTVKIIPFAWMKCGFTFHSYTEPDDISKANERNGARVWHLDGKQAFQIIPK